MHMATFRWCFFFLYLICSTQTLILKRVTHQQLNNFISLFSGTVWNASKRVERESKKRTTKQTKKLLQFILCTHIVSWLIRHIPRKKKKTHRHTIYGEQKFYFTTHLQQQLPAHRQCVDSTHMPNSLSLIYVLMATFNDIFFLNTHISFLFIPNRKCVESRMHEFINLFSSFCFFTHKL